MGRVRCMCSCNCPNAEGPGNGSETDDGLCVECREGLHQGDDEDGDFDLGGSD